jgi:ankyrin repeat protein
MSESSSESDTDFSESSSLKSEVDPFNEFVNGNPYNIIDWVLDGRVDKDTADDDHGEPLLIWACRHRIYELVEFLVEQGCDINTIAHSDGETALDLCSNCPSLVKFLKEHGAKTSEEVCAEEDEDSASPAPPEN